ncbi:hypothetical protein K2173_004117 [Erythroxylum novogranatense]|uniref:4-coumarate--CoA ligase n=1 Tax=Erythroxylum novogranatense TaxID=1862640 RepID=A0AAV8SYJ8_9ROSI|nr:hypothetical protein K2173_004117 [Erythroxylum novogranatense]
MTVEESSSPCATATFTAVEEQNAVEVPPTFHKNSGFDSCTGIYHSLLQLGDKFQIPDKHELNIAEYVLSHICYADDQSRVALVDSATNQVITYSELRQSVHTLASVLYHVLGVRKGDVVLVLSPNSILYPIICLSIFAIGAILSPANPVSTESEIGKQLRESNPKLLIIAPEEQHKLAGIGIQVLLTTRTSNEDVLCVEKLIESCNPPLELPETQLTQSDIGAILYSSGTAGASKGVILTHANIIANITILKWLVHATSSQEDVFLCFIPMFHVYGLTFFGLGLFTAGVTSVIMQKFDFQAMLNAIETYQVNHIPAVPPVILGLVKCAGKLNCNLSSLRRVGSGAAPLSKKLAEEFRESFPWVELRPGYGLTETSGSTAFFLSNWQAEAHPASCGMLLPGFCAKVADIETGLALPPCEKGELWIKSPTVMKEYLENEEATESTLDSEGWLRSGDLGFFDEDGFLHIIDRMKELIKYNGFQVAPAELETILLSHPQVLDAAVIPVEDEETGQTPMAYVVKAPGSKLTKQQVIQFVACQVSPYKKIRRVGFISSIPKSAAGKIQRKQLVLHTQQQLTSKM